MDCNLGTTYTHTMILKKHIPPTHSKPDMSNMLIHLPLALCLLREIGMEIISNTPRNHHSPIRST